MALTLASGLGCVARTSDEFQIDSEATLAERQAFIDAAAEWCSASQNEYCVEIVDSSRNTFVVADDMTPCLEPSVAGCWRTWVDHPGDPIKEEVRIRSGLSWELTRIAALHELGHRFGLHDSVECGRMMSKGIYTPDGQQCIAKSITQADLNAIPSSS